MDFDILQLVDVEIIINGKFIEGKQIVQPKKKQICYRLNVDSNEKLNKTKINESKIKKLASNHIDSIEIIHLSILQ